MTFRTPSDIGRFPDIAVTLYTIGFMSPDGIVSKMRVEDRTECEIDSLELVSRPFRFSYVNEKSQKVIIDDVGNMLVQFISYGDSRKGAIPTVDSDVYQTHRFLVNQGFNSFMRSYRELIQKTTKSMNPNTGNVEDIVVRKPEAWKSAKHWLNKARVMSDEGFYRLAYEPLPTS